MIEISDAPIQSKKSKKQKKRKTDEKGDDLASTDSDSEAKSYGRRDSQSSVGSTPGDVFIPQPTITPTYQAGLRKIRHIAYPYTPGYANF